MSNILINGLKSKAGGGKNIIDNYLQKLSVAIRKHHYYVLTPDINIYKRFNSENLTIIDVKNIYKPNVFFLALYYIQMPLLLRKYKIDIIFNFGDVIIPSKIPQIYFFDWAYAIYNIKHIAKKMDFVHKLTMKTKIFLIKNYIKKVSLVLAQTQTMAKRLETIYSLPTVHIVPTPVANEFSSTSQHYDFQLPQNKRKFLFPASYSYHKNFEILVPLGKLIVKENLPFVIVLTLDELKAKELFHVIKLNSLEKVMLNVGWVELNKMSELYKQCDALFLPTLLESYGLPYIEAMSYNKPILTSDLDFAHDVCGNSAYYFNPFDPYSALEKMKQVFFDENEFLEIMIVAKEKLKQLPDWEYTFNQFQEKIEQVLNKKQNEKSILSDL